MILPGEQPLFNLKPYLDERDAADAQATGAELSRRLQASGKSIDLATATIHESPLFAAVIEPVNRRLFNDPTFFLHNRAR